MFIERRSYVDDHTGFAQLNSLRVEHEHMSSTHSHFYGRACLRLKMKSAFKDRTERSSKLTLPKKYVYQKQEVIFFVAI